MTSESLGMVEGQLRLVEYDDRWPGVFEELRGCLVRRLKHRVESVHHVGSTSVPGLAAKPILDVLVAVPDFEASLECVPLLAKLGFEYGPEDDVVDRHYFRGRRDGLRTHHLSLAEPTSRYFIDTLAFRDALRASPRLAAEYEALKARLVREHVPGAHFHHGKTDFVREALGWYRRGAKVEDLVRRAPER